MYNFNKKAGPLRGSNPGPPAPEAGIIPLDQVDKMYIRNGNVVYLMKHGRTMSVQQNLDSLCMFHKVYFTCPYMYSTSINV